MATRDKNGRFVKGNPGSPGRKPREVERQYKDAFAAAVSHEDWLAIIKTAVTDAKAGDAVARKWLTDYLVGLPTQRTEITGADGGALHNEIIIRYADDNPADAITLAATN